MQTNSKAPETKGRMPPSDGYGGGVRKKRRLACRGRPEKLETEPAQEKEEKPKGLN